MASRTIMLFSNNGLRKRAKLYFGFLVSVKLFSLK